MREIWDEVRTEERLILIQNTMTSLQCTLKRAMEILMLPSEDYDIYLRMLR